jgi:hypothetical protein
VLSSTWQYGIGTSALLLKVPGCRQGCSRKSLTFLNFLREAGRKLGVGKSRAKFSFQSVL